MKPITAANVNNFQRIPKEMTEIFEATDSS